MVFDLCHFLLNILIFCCIWIAFDKILVGDNFSFIYRGVMNLDLLQISSLFALVFRKPLNKCVCKQ